MASALRKDKRAKQLIQQGREHETLTEKISALESELASMRSDLNARAIVGTDLQTQLATAREAVASLESQASAAVAEAARVTRLFNEQGATLAALRDTSDAQAARLVKLETEERDASKLRRRLADQKAWMHNVQLELSRYRAAAATNPQLRDAWARLIPHPVEITGDTALEWMSKHQCEGQGPRGFSEEAYSALTAKYGQRQSTHRRITCRSCGGSWVVQEPTA